MDMRDMLRAVVNNYNIRRALKNVDIFSATAPCQGRSVLRLENNNENLDSPYSEDELFFMQLILIELLKLKRVISEMTPPNHKHHQDHFDVARNIQNLGYEVIVTPRFASDLCGDYQHRERWILIGRRLPTQYPALKLPEFRILDRMQHRGPPLKDILEDPRDVSASTWIRDSKNRISLDVFRQIYTDPIPINKDARKPFQVPYTGGTLVSNYENAELTMLLDRLAQYPEVSLVDGCLVLGAETPPEVLSNPIVAKIWTMVHNIMYRCGVPKDTYIINMRQTQNKHKRDTIEVAHTLGAAMDQLAITRVGYPDWHQDKGDTSPNPDFELRCPVPTSYPGQRNKYMYRPVDVYQRVYCPKTAFGIKEIPVSGICYSIVAFQRHNHDAETKRNLIRTMNRFASRTVVLDENNLAIFRDPHFTLEEKHLARSVYLGHLHGSTKKGAKVYSIERSCPTYTSYDNVLIKDNRDPKFTGIRKLTKKEVIRLNSPPGEIRAFLENCEHNDACKYVANAIPTRMLHTIYSAVLDDLKRPLVPIQTANASTPSLNMLAFNNLRDNKASAADACRMLMGCLKQKFETPDLPNRESRCLNLNSQRAKDICAKPGHREFGKDTIPLCVHGYPDDSCMMLGNEILSEDRELDTNVSKRRSLRVKHRTSKHTPRDDTTRAIRRMRIFHRIHHCNSEIAEETRKITLGSRLLPGDAKHNIPCAECEQAARDRNPSRKQFRDTSHEFEQKFNTGECFAVDGLHPTEEAIGGFRYAIVFICIRSKLPLVYPVVDLTAKEFKKALEFVMHYVTVKLKRSIKMIYADMFSSFREFQSREQSVAAFRETYGIELTSPPPHAHHLNGEVESLIGRLKRGTRANLLNLVGTTLAGQRVVDPSLYWAYAMEHKRQSLAWLYSTSLHKRYPHVPCSPMQKFMADYEPQKMDLKIFGAIGFKLIEKGERKGQMGDVREPVRYLFNGQLNPLVNKTADQPSADIVLRCRDNMVLTTIKTNWPYEHHDFMGERDAILDSVSGTSINNKFEQVVQAAKTPHDLLDEDQEVVVETYKRGTPEYDAVEEDIAEVEPAPSYTSDDEAPVVNPNVPSISPQVAEEHNVDNLIAGRMAVVLYEKTSTPNFHIVKLLEKTRGRKKWRAQYF